MLVQSLPAIQAVENLAKFHPWIIHIRIATQVAKNVLLRGNFLSVKGILKPPLILNVNADKKTFTLSLNGEKQSDSFDVNMDLKTKKGNVNIKKLIPKDALDLTAVLKSLQSKTGGYSNSQIGGFSNNSGIANY